MQIKQIHGGERAGMSRPILKHLVLLNGKFNKSSAETTDLQRGDKVKISNEFVFYGEVIGRRDNLVSGKRHGVRRYDVLPAREGVVNEVRQNPHTGRIMVHVVCGEMIIKIKLKFLEKIS